MAETGQTLVLTVGMPLLVAADWTWQALWILDSDSEVSAKVVLAWLSFIAAGIGLGAALVVLSLRRAGRLGRTPGVSVQRNRHPTFFLMFGLLQASMAAGPVYQGVTSVWDWTFLISTSVVGGAFIGAAHGMQQALIDRLAASQETARTGS